MDAETCPPNWLVFLAQLPSKPSSARGEHLAQVHAPMLFIQGTRDALAERSRMEVLTAQLGERATLHWVEDADHSFHARARTGRSDSQARAALLEALATWVDSLP